MNSFGRNEKYMKTIKKLSIRMIMTLLFIGALLATIQSITGLEVRTFVTSLNEEIEDDTYRNYFSNSMKGLFTQSVKANSEISIC